jgi:nucleotide-binding universal stress UspA family protein
VLVTAVQQVGIWDATLTIQVMEREEELAQQYLEEQAAQLRAAGAEVEIRISRGEAAEAVLSVAEDEKADLVAISTRGRSGVSRWLFGSTASRILQVCSTPVLVLHPKTGEDKGAPGPVIKKILVPLDGSDLAASIVPQVEELAKTLGASLVFFNAVAPIATYPGFETAQVNTIGSVIEELQEQAKAILGRAAEDAIKRGVQAQCGCARHACRRCDSGADDVGADCRGSRTGVAVWPGRAGQRSGWSGSPGADRRCGDSTRHRHMAVRPVVLPVVNQLPALTIADLVNCVRPLNNPGSCQRR